LTPHGRRVFVALALNGVQLVVLAKRSSTTRDVLHETLAQARTKTTSMGRRGSANPVEFFEATTVVCARLAGRSVAHRIQARL
jgi:hypothetical protein